MMLIDTHAHIYHKQFATDTDAMLQRCKAASVGVVIMPNIDEESISPMLELAKKSDSELQLLPMMGLHPCDVKENIDEQLSAIKKHLDTGTYYGIGETGLDYYWDITFKAQQIQSLHTHAQWAAEKNLPLIIHSRNSTADCIEVVSHYKGKISGIFHCFSGSMDEAQQIIELGFHLGIGGTLTYKNSAELQQVIKAIDLSHIVLETDAPYLSPMPHRGKRNESSYVKHVAEFMAALKGVTLNEVSATTTANAKKIFRI